MVILEDCFYTLVIFIKYFIFISSYIKDNILELVNVSIIKNSALSK